MLINSDLTSEQKREQWLNVINHFQGDHSKCLHKGTETKLRIELSQNEKEKINQYLRATCDYFMSKHLGYHTNFNESLHHLRNFYAKKDISWKYSYGIRTMLAVLHWNMGITYIIDVFKYLEIPLLEHQIKCLLKTMKLNRTLKNQRSSIEYRTKSREYKIRKKSLLSKKVKNGYNLKNSKDVSLTKLMDKIEMINNEEEEKNEESMIIKNEEITDYMHAIKSSLIGYYPNIQGIINIGNSCYFSSIIQCLIHSSKLLLEEIRNLKGKHYVTKLQNIICRVINSGCAVNPSNEFKTLTKLFTEKGVQQDAGEFLLFMIDRITDEIQTNSFKEMFRGKIKNIFTCSNCKKYVETFDDFLILFLNIPNNFLDSLIKYEIQEQNIEYRCTHCNRNDTTKKITQVMCWPKILIVQNMQFQLNQLKNKEIMIQKEFITMSTPTYCYKLKCIVCHYGNKEFGHYTTAIIQSDKIYEISDDSISETSFKTVAANAYMIFYEMQ